MKKMILLLIAIVLTLSMFIAASALALPVGTEICAEDNESSLQAAAMPAQGGVGNYSKGDTSNITPVAVSADTGDNLGNPAKKMLNDTPSNESNLTKRYVDDKGRVLDEVIVPGLPPEERISRPDKGQVPEEVIVPGLPPEERISRPDKGQVPEEVIVPGLPPEERISEPPVLTKRYVDDKGRVLDEVIVPGLPPEERISGPPVSSFEITRADAILPNVPAFDWCYGCSATSAAMLFGYYDRTGYPNMYTGPTNGGVCPLDNSAWGYEECSLSATHQGFDGLAVKGHVDDYWSTFGSTVDPYYGHWTEHGYADCTADFMGTNQYVNWQNADGTTRFYYAGSNPVCDYSGCEPGKKRDGCHGIRLFVESRGYNVVQNCNQRIDEYAAGGFTYADFKAEIDAGRPVLIHVEGHTMLGFGYNDPDTIYIHDTWGHTDHSMTWGGSYSGRQHKGVTFIQLEPASGPTAVDYGIFRNGLWAIDTTGNHLADLVFAYGIAGDVPVVGDFPSYYLTQSTASQPGVSGGADQVEYSQVGNAAEVAFYPSEPISFKTPLAPHEIAYDDGVADEGWAWLNAGGERAVRFTPPSYPVDLKTARINIWPNWPDSNHEEFGVVVYDDDGTSGAPGTQLGQVSTTATDWGWHDVDISGLGITISSGDFYIAYHQLTDSPNCEAISIDSSSPDGRSWKRASGGMWEGVSSGDYMIRTIVETGGGGELDDYGIFRGGQWAIDTTGNHLPDLIFAYGIAGDVPLVGDMNHNGISDYGIFRNGMWAFDTTGNHLPDLIFAYGIADDVPIVGDINGDGISDYGIFRGGMWAFDTTGNHLPDLIFAYGIADDVPIVGDINGDGISDYGIFRNGMWAFDTTGNHLPDLIFAYGIANDVPLVGNMG